MPSSPVCCFSLSSPLGPARPSSKNSMASALLLHSTPPHPTPLLQTLDKGGRSQAQGVLWALLLVSSPFRVPSSSPDHWAMEKDEQLAWHPGNGYEENEGLRDPGCLQPPKLWRPGSHPSPSCLHQRHGSLGASCLDTLIFWPTVVERPNRLGEGGAWRRSWESVVSLRA